MTARVTTHKILIRTHKIKMVIKAMSQTKRESLKITKKKINTTLKMVEIRQKIVKKMIQNNKIHKIKTKLH